jgi:tetratricopeptide (TPR) repeat protein
MALEYGLEKAVIVQTHREGPGKALFLQELARICAFNNLASEAEDYGSRALMMARKTGPIEAHIDSLTTLAMIGGQFNPDKVAMLDQAVELAEEHGLPTQESKALNNRAVARFLNFADFVGAFDDYNRAVDIIHRIGDFFSEQYFLGGLVLMSIFLGRYNLSHKLLARLGRMLAETSDPGPLFFRYHGIKALISFDFGDYDSSFQQSQAVFREAEAKNNSSYKVWANLLIARILLFREDAIQAIKHLEDVVVESRGVENYSEHEVNSYLVIAHTLAGDLLKASELITISENRLRESGWPLYDRTLFIRAKAHFAAANKQWNDSWNLFEEAVEQFHKMNRPWLVAKTRQEWGETHLLRAEPEDKIRGHHLISEAAQDFDALDIPMRVDACRQILETLK